MKIKRIGKAVVPPLILVGALSLGFTGGVVADELTVWAGAWSKHFSSDKGYNETHNLVAIDYRSATAGYFKNSNGVDTVFAAKKWDWQLSDSWEASLLGGVTYGYSDCRKMKDKEDPSKKVCPMIAPMLTYTGFDLIEPYAAVFGNAAAIGVKAEFDLK